MTARTLVRLLALLPAVYALAALLAMARQIPTH